MVRIIDNIVLAPIPKAGYSSIGFFIASGAICEQGDKVGTAHLLEHMLFAGNHFDLNVEAYTQLEQMVFLSTQLPENTVTNLSRLQDLLFKVPLQRKDLTIQRERIKLELLTAYQHCKYQGAYGKIFGKKSGQYSGWSGSPEDIESINFDSLEEYRQKYVTPERTVVVISGEFNDDDVMKTVSSLGLQCSFDPCYPLQQIRLHENLVWNTHIDIDVANVDIFIPTSPLSDFKNRSLNKLYTSCLTGNNLSLLDTMLYKELGTVYSISSQSLYWTNGGVSIIGYQTLVDRAEETADRVNDLITNLPKHLNEEIVKSAREFSLLEHEIIMDDPNNLAWWLGEDLLLTGKIISPEEQKDYLSKYTLEDIQNMAKVVATMPVVVVKQ